MTICIFSPFIPLHVHEQVVVMFGMTIYLVLLHGHEGGIGVPYARFRGSSTRFGDYHGLRYI